MSHRSIRATLHVKNNPGPTTRTYARLATAIPRAVQVLLLMGKPNDSVVLTHQDFNFPIATITKIGTCSIHVEWTLKTRGRLF